jgi:hypothetical protein
MLMLALVFQTLAVRRPDLDAGVYAYAKAGFGEYLGFFSAFGYWASACVGNVTWPRRHAARDRLDPRVFADNLSGTWSRRPRTGSRPGNGRGSWRNR